MARYIWYAYWRSTCNKSRSTAMGRSCGRAWEGTIQQRLLMELCSFMIQPNPTSWLKLPNSQVCSRQGMSGCLPLYFRISLHIPPLAHFVLADRLTCTASDALDASPLPFLLVACKCDLRPEDSGLTVAHDRHEIYRTSPESPRSQQMCIALVLRSVISSREGQSIFPIVILRS